MTCVKNGVILVRENASGTWIQTVMEFDPESGIMTLNGEKKIVEKSCFKVEPSPFCIPQYPDAFALHMYPVDGAENSELHISGLDRKEILDWSYYFQRWIRSRSPLLEVLIPPLGQEDEDEFESLMMAAASTSSAAGDLLIDKFNIPITCKTLRCLGPEEWLSDEVVNFYFSLLQESSEDKVFCWNSFFYTKLTSPAGYAGVKSWTAKRNISLFPRTGSSIKRMLIPVHTVDHWSLGVVDFEKKCTRFLDSLGGVAGNDFHDIIMNYLKQELKQSNGASEDPTLLEGWRRKKNHRKLPLQTNGSDCGVFICMYALALATGNSLVKSGIGSDKVLLMRKRIALDMVHGFIGYWPNTIFS